MNEKVLKTLEYNKILNQLSEYACSPEAKKESIASVCVSIYNIDWYDFSCMDQKVKQIQA